MWHALAAPPLATVQPSVVYVLELPRTAVLVPLAHASHARSTKANDPCGSAWLPAVTAAALTLAPRLGQRPSLRRWRLQSSWGGCRSGTLVDSFTTAASVPSRSRSFSSTSCMARGQAQSQETEEQRLELDRQARKGMEAYMKRIEELASKGNVRAQKTSWKWSVRRTVWNYLEDNDLAEFPRPVHHRIPNFKGSDAAGQRLAQLPEFGAATVVKVNPDTPQKSVRVATLEAGKTLYVPQPRLRTGFFSRIMPGQIPAGKFNFAATANGMKQLAQPMDLDDRTKIDIVVVGSSAVNPENGARIGKGEGFAELEYGMLRQLGLIDESTPVVCTVHDCQVVTENMPPPGKDMMKHDVPVDIIVTPTQTIRVDPAKRLPKPTGIYWDLLSREKLSQIRVLQTLKEKIERETGSELPLAQQEEALPPLAKRGSQGSGRRSAGQRSAPSSAKPTTDPPGIRGRLSRPSRAQK